MITAKGTEKLVSNFYHIHHILQTIFNHIQSLVYQQDYINYLIAINHTQILNKILRNIQNEKMFVRLISQTKCVFIPFK